MAIKLPDFLKGGKSRVFIILGALVGSGFAIFLAAQFLGNNTQINNSKVAGAPPGLQSVPGSKMSPEFYRAVTQASSQAAQQAKITGGSAVPTLINIPGEQAFPKETSGCVICSEEAADAVGDVNSLVKSGKLSKEEADKLINLAKKNVSEEEYAAALNDLVQGGKLSPDQARKLLESYRKQNQNQLIKASASTMDDLIKNSQLPLSTANQLLALQKSGISAGDYNAELQRLVAAGKITPDVAQKLLTQYQQQRAQLGETPAQPVAAGALDTLTKETEAGSSADIDALQAAGKLSPDIANQLRALSQQNIPPDQYKKIVDQLAKDGKISPEDGKKLTDGYQKLSGTRGLLARLLDMKNKKAPVAQYTEELTAGVRGGWITPKQAAALLDEYSAPPPSAKPSIGPAPAANISGSGDFAKLQERLRKEEEAQPAAAPSAADEQQFAEAAAQAQQAAADERNKRLSDIMSAMSAQAGQLISAWQPVAMVHQDGVPPVISSAQGAGNTGAAGTETGTPAAGTGAPASPPLIKAGTILFAVLDTAVNSDYPDSPVMATIIDGKYKGAKLLGKLSMAANQDRVSLTFTLMNMDAWPTSQSINAFAIDPDTAHTVLASSVDNHYLKRYGALFASSFVSGYSDAILQSGNTQTTGVFGTTSTSASFSPGNKIAVGVGAIGKALNTSVSKYIDLPPTVIVNSGVGLGILFMSDVTLGAAQPASAPTTPAPLSTPSASAIPTTPQGLINSAGSLVAALRSGGTAPATQVPATTTTTK